MMKPKSLLKTVVNGIVGISLEILLVAIFIAAGFLVSLLWWRIFR